MVTGKIPLRSLVISGACALAILGTVAAIYLLISARLHQESARIADEAAHSIRAAEELEQSLRAHARLDDAGVGSGAVLQAVDYDEQRRAIERDIAHSFGEIEQHVDSAEEGALVASVESKIQRYLERHAQDMSAGLTPEASYKKNNPMIRDIEKGLEELSRVNVDQADDMSKAIVARANRGELLGMISAISLISIMTVLLLGLDRHLYRPLVRITEAMEAFAAGRPSVRAPRAKTAEIDRIARTFNDMAQTIENQKSAQLRFLAAIAHDLRNPLGAIRMSADLLKETAAVAPDDQPLLDVVVRQVGHLDRLVGDLLETMRTEAGGLSICREPTDLRALVADAILLHKQTSSLHRIVFDSDPQPIPCNGDPARLSQVMNNLIGNAIKYSPNGGRVNIRVFKTGDQAQVQVSDEGLGIAEDELDAIFEPFRRSDATRNAIPGVGLGLSVSRKIIEAHGGTVTVQSRIGAGSTFTVHLPVEKVGDEGTLPFAVAALPSDTGPTLAHVH